MPTEGSGVIRIVICDSSRMGTQLLAEVLARDERFMVLQAHDPEDVLRTDVDAALISVNFDGQPMGGCQLAKQFRATRPNSQVIMLVEKPNRNMVLDIFRSGARGIFSRSGALSTLTKCITTVHSGQVWAGNSEIHFLLEAVEEPIKLRLMDAKGRVLLSNREQEVARWVVEGLSNREIAVRMNLSEHTVKNYLFRIFDKLGISNRVELMLYAFSQLGPSPVSSSDTAPQAASPADITGWCQKEVGDCAIAHLTLAEMYTEGKKVPRDPKTALMWFLVADALAVEITERSRAAQAQLRREMSSEHVFEAQHRAAEWIRSRNDNGIQSAKSNSSVQPTNATAVAVPIPKAKRAAVRRDAVAS